VNDTAHRVPGTAAPAAALPGRRVHRGGVSRPQGSGCHFSFGLAAGHGLTCGLASSCETTSCSVVSS